jgi:hypothetical protein
MKEKNTSIESPSMVCYQTMEAKARERIQMWLQDLLEVEVTEFLGRAKSASGSTPTMPQARSARRYACDGRSSLRRALSTRCGERTSRRDKARRTDPSATRLRACSRGPSAAP